MTPQERALVTELFDRLASLEKTPRDPEAERLIADGLSRAPNAVYALVQTMLLQDEALNRADARIRELEGETPPAGSFLDAARSIGLGAVAVRCRQSRLARSGIPGAPRMRLPIPRLRPIAMRPIRGAAVPSAAADRSSARQPPPQLALSAAICCSAVCAT